MSDTAIHQGSYLSPSLEHATVADAMHPGIFSCEPDASLTEVARTMATRHVHCLAVVGISHQQPECGMWGIVSDADVIRAAAREGGEGTAGSLAKQPVVSVTPAMALRAASELMVSQEVSHLVVIDEGSQNPIGILSTLDIAGVLGWGEA
jgi:CBS domain-containing protein